MRYNIINCIIINNYIRKLLKSLLNNYGVFMKKILLKVFIAILCVCTICSTLVGCKDSEWGGTSMKDWGEVKKQSLGGFVAETENYIYLINGSANSNDSNSFGKPVKGALIAVEKASFGTGNVKTEVVVPKLFASKDYSAGVYIFDNYVYYGSPSTDKRPDGTIAKTEMKFLRTKLDGTGTTELFTTSTLALEYRMVEASDGVYVVYYNSQNSSIISKNLTTGKTITVAKTDEKTAGRESLNNFVIMENEVTGQAVVVYTTTVYTTDYNTEMVEDGNQRPTASYNKVYAYKAGDGLAPNEENYGTLIYDGSVGDKTYDILQVDKKYVFYTQTNLNQVVETYGVSIEAFMQKQTGEKVFADYVKTTNLIESLEEVYVLDTEKGELYKDTMLLSQKGATKHRVAVCSTLSSLIMKKGDFIYYYNSNNKICKIFIGAGKAEYTFGEQTVEYVAEEASEILVSDDTVATTWYQPEIVTLNGVEYLFYCDNSAEGLEYIKYVSLSNQTIANDTDEDEKADEFLANGGVFAAKITNKDKARIFDSKVNKVSGKLENGVLPLEEDNEGKYFSALINGLREEYDNLPQAIKENVKSETVEKLETYEKAIDISNLLKTLDGVKDIEEYEETDAEYIALENAYNSIKKQMNKHYSSSNYESIDALIENDLKANFTKARNTFDAE